ncbi:MAG: CoA pyrophosphatase [Clostridiales bacterium]|nr:CoA pyrophosphatase [Clostridiales bacterium]
MLNNIKNSISNHYIKPEGKNKVSAVLLPLITVDDEIHILFEVRSHKLNTQPGEICLPGGGKKEDGELPILSALRETMEELNILENQIEIYGGVDTIITPFNLIVHPFVGYLKITDLDSIKYSKDEVDHIFTVPLNFFTEKEPTIYDIKNNFDLPENFPYNKIPKGINYTWKEGHYPVHFYEYNGYVIWGITARIVYNFTHIIKGLSIF